MHIKVLRGDVILKVIVAAAALFIIGLLVALAVELYAGSAASIGEFGPAFLIGRTWDPVHEIFGALPFIYGTLLTSAIAILIGLPISLGVAIFISERLKSHQGFGYLLGTVVDLLAAVPSVIYGLWGLLILSPFLRDYVEKPLHQSLGFIPLFSGTPFGLDFFTAGIILAIMIIPTMSAVSRNVLNAVPNSQREAMYSLGATEWEVTQKSVLPYARSGIFGAFILGLGRAVGETMAVTMVIGNTPRITANLFSGGYTLSSLIANEFGESSGLYQSAIIEIALILFLVALVINIFARLLLWRMTRGTRVKI
ncbi:MAG: phosphate ABC transporter permease subunit PstC [Candidatus Bathyarchaeia archaeon]